MYKDGLITSLKELKKEHEAIAIIWQTDDVLLSAEDEYNYRLTVEQANEILRNVQDNADCNIGINWEIINEYIRDY